MIKPKRIKRLIKIIRRKDAEATAVAHVKKPDGSNPKKEARLKLRTLDSTVLRWVSERRENSRIEENAAMQMLDGNLLLAGR